MIFFQDNDKMVFLGTGMAIFPSQNFDVHIDCPDCVRVDPETQQPVSDHGKIYLTEPKQNTVINTKESRAFLQTLSLRVANSATSLVGEGSGGEHTLHLSTKTHHTKDLETLYRYSKACCGFATGSSRPRRWLSL